MAKTALCLSFLVFSLFVCSFALDDASSSHIREAETSHLVRSVNGNTQGAWPWDRSKFKCPTLNGAFSNPDDCSSFFLCVAGISSKMHCKRLHIFDKFHKKCLSLFIAICDKTGHTTDSPKPTKGKVTTSKGKVTSSKGKVTTSKDKVTTSRDVFICPSVFGTFTHPTDCSKYYSCTIFIPNMKSCPDNELFDGVKLLCKPAKDVNCGSRIKPTEPPILTTEPISEPEPEPTISTTTTSKPEPETPEPAISTTTTTKPEPETPEPTISTTTETEPPEPETPEPETTTEGTTKPTGPPETDCDENDLDCIIDDTGVTPDWFTCPEDMGSHPHPSSQKLFIFCLNWIPSVKKCGQDLVYSNELRTCVDP